MYPSVKEVITGSDYILTVVFDNGESGILDMKPILDFGVFQRIKDIDAFLRVRVAFDTIEWDCGMCQMLRMRQILSRRGENDGRSAHKAGGGAVGDELR